MLEEAPDEEVDEAMDEEVEDLVESAPEAEAEPVVPAAAAFDVAELAFFVEPEEEEDDETADELDEALSDADEVGGAPQNV